MESMFALCMPLVFCLFVRIGSFVVRLSWLNSFLFLPFMCLQYPSLLVLHLYPVSPRSDLADPPFSEPTGATITLNNDRVLYLRGVNQYMALACIIHEESLEKIGMYHLFILFSELARYRYVDLAVHFELNSMLVSSFSKRYTIP